MGKMKDLTMDIALNGLNEDVDLMYERGFEDGVNAVLNLLKDPVFVEKFSVKTLT